MKILIHLNHNINKTFLFVLHEPKPQEELARLVETAEPEAVLQRLASASDAMVEIPPSELKRFELLADLTFNQLGYTSERLA